MKAANLLVISTISIETVWWTFVVDVVCPHLTSWGLSILSLSVIDGNVCLFVTFIFFVVSECCVFQKQRAFNESDSEDSDTDGEGDEDRSFQAYKKRQVVKKHQTKQRKLLPHLNSCYDDEPNNNNSHDNKDDNKDDSNKASKSHTDLPSQSNTN